MIGEASARH